MIKYYCDLCGEEVKEESNWSINLDYIKKGMSLVITTELHKTIKVVSGNYTSFGKDGNLRQICYKCVLKIIKKNLKKPDDA